MIGFEDSVFLKRWYCVLVFLRYGVRNQVDEFLEDTKSIVRCFDNFIKKIRIDRREDNVFVKVEHNDFTDDIDINQESAGTRELFCHIYDI